MLTKLRVQAKITGRQESRVADYALDDLGEAPMMLLPTQDGERKEDKTAKRLYRTLSTDLPDDLKQKLVSLLAAEFSKKVRGYFFNYDQWYIFEIIIACIDAGLRDCIR